LDIKYKYIRFTGKVIAILPFILLINCFVFVLITLEYAIATASSEPRDTIVRFRQPRNERLRQRTCRQLLTNDLGSKLAAVAAVAFISRPRLIC